MIYNITPISNKSKNILQLSFKRLASTKEIPTWPNKIHPSPYEVLGIAPSEANDTKKLRKQYRDLCKLYHPDLSSSKQLYDHKGQLMTQKDKETRFKTVSSAYSLVCDPVKKDQYDRYKMGWHSGGGSSQFHEYKHNFHGQSRYNPRDQRFWDAGNWEDYSNLRRNKGTPEDAKEVERKNKEVLVMAVGLALFVFCAQIANGLDSYYKEREVVDSENYEAHNSLLLAYLNHGLGLDKWSRIRTFLWNRRYGLYGGDEEMLEKKEAEDEEIIRRLMGKVGSDESEEEKVTL